MPEGYGRSSGERLVLWLGYRKLHAEAAASSSQVARGQRTAVGLDDLAADGQPQPGPAALAAASGLVDLIEPLEDARQFIRRDSGSVILDVDGDPAGGAFGANGHALTAGGVLDGVVQQVGEDLRQAIAVADNRWQRRQGVVKDNSLIGGAQAEPLANGANQCGDIYRLPFEAHLSGIQPGQVEQIDDQPPQPVGLVVDHLSRVAGWRRHPQPYHPESPARNPGSR